MRIESLHIDGFGVWHSLQLDALADRITVFYGPNEAGKTTLLQFIRTVLYGFSPMRRQRYLPPLHGGRPGGTLKLRGSSGLVTVSRHAGAHEPATGELRVSTSAGGLDADHALGGLLGGIDETTFNHVFAIGLREIQELGTLSDSTAAELLYQLSTGLNGVSLAEVLAELAASRERLLAAGRPGQIEALLERRDALQSEIEELRGLVHRQAAVTHEHAELSRAIAEQEARRGEFERQARVIEAAVTVRAVWQQRAAVAGELASLPEITPVPLDALDRLEAIEARLARGQRQLARLVRARKAARRQIAALPFNHRLAQCAPRIEALAEQEGWLNTLESQVEQISSETAALEAELAEHKQSLGLHGDAGDLPEAAARLARLRPAARAIHEPRARIKAAQLELTEAQTQADKLASQIRTALSHTPDKELGPALERAGNLVARLRRRVQLDERLDELSRHENELAEQGRQLLDRQLLPGWVLIALGGVFALGTVLILAAFFSPAAIVGHAGWALATLGALGAAGAAAGKFLLERAAATQLDVCQKQAAMLTAQIKQLKQERDTADAELPRGGGPLVTRLQTAEKELATLEELLGVESQRQAAAKAAAAAQARIDVAQSDCRAARRRWRKALRSVGLPENLSPSQARHFASRRRQLAPLEERLTRQRQELSDRRREFDTLCGRIRQLLADVGLETVEHRAAENGATARLDQLRQALDEHQTVAARRDELKQRADRLRRRHLKTTRAVRRAEKHRRQLLASLGVESDAVLRARIAEQDRRQSLVECVDRFSHEIAAVLGGRLAEADLAAWLDGDQAAELEAKWDELVGSIQAIGQDLQVQFEHRGRLAHELQMLADDRRPGERALALAEIEQQLREAVERWRVLAVTELTLDAVRRTYEAERQPEALADASNYLQRLTEGRYTRIWTPLGERSLRVDDAEGNSLPVEVLSRGTREQVFLGLRLALVAAYARQGVDLPLVLDDVLVNFDAKRARAAAAALRDFAADGHQVLVFTCHEHLCKIFKSLKIVTHHLPANDDSEPVTVAYARPETEPAEHAPPEEEHAPAAIGWRPEAPAAPLLHIDDAGAAPQGERTTPKRRARRRRSSSEVNQELAAAANADRSNGPHPVTIVRGDLPPQLFADVLAHEHIDGDDADEGMLLPRIDMADDDSDDEQATPWEDVSVDEVEAAEERMFLDSDDWRTVDLDEDPDDHQAA